ncbi:acyl carrier protein [Alphaproteobacteria bacterium]|nr:acyl carrier protein [Alphaproteobacteria bacterium]
MTIIKSLEVIFRDVFDDEDLLIYPDSTANDIDGWDSLAHIRLILEIEKRFSLHFKASEIEKLENVGQMAELILLRRAND